MEILEKGERAAACYGLTKEYITDEQIKALKEGKRLYFTVEHEEYAVVIKYKKEVRIR